MNAVTRERLLAEAARLPRDRDHDTEALRWAILVEEALGVTLTDDQILAGPSRVPSDPPR